MSVNTNESLWKKIILPKLLVNR